MHYPSAHPAPPVWRASADPEGTAAAPVDNGARPQYPQTTATPSPSKFRMQFPQDTDPCTLKNRRISTIRLQHLKYTQGNCMRNCRDVVRTQYHAATRPHWCGGCQRGRRAREDSRRRAKSHISDPAQLVWRVPEGPEGTGGFEATRKVAHQRPGPLVWRASEGLEGLAAVLVGGGGAWPDNESTRRVKLAARTTRGRAAAHGHAKQPGPGGSPAQRAARPHTPTGGAQCES